MCGWAWQKSRPSDYGYCVGKVQTVFAKDKRSSLSFPENQKRIEMFLRLPPASGFKLAKPGNYYWRGRISTVDLLIQTSSNQLLLYKRNFQYFNFCATLWQYFNVFIYIDHTYNDTTYNGTNYNDTNYNDTTYNVTAYIDTACTDTAYNDTTYKMIILIKIILMMKLLPFHLFSLQAFYLLFTDISSYE